MAGDDERTAIVNLAKIRPARALLRDRHLLVRVKGGQVGQVFSVKGLVWRVGRARESELFLEDSGVSRQHARLTQEAEYYRLEDLGSVNGTYVNGESIGQHRLADGDLVQFGPSAVFRYEVTDADQESLLEELYDASVTDSLTGAYNREYFDSRLEAELSYARRHRTELGLLLLDIDSFKLVNDTRGHQAGDLVLVELVAALSRNLRAEDVFARYGGEEFAVILRDAGITTARGVADRFRVAVEDLRIQHAGEPIPITVSIGVASLGCCESKTGAALVALADRRLYGAKRQGRNCVVAED